jgi:hypothetical protein
VLLGLGNMNTKDSVFHRGLDVVLVDTGREGEAAGELANAALGNPELGFIRSLSALILLGDFGGSLSTLVLNSSLVSLVILLAFGNGSLGWCTLDEASGWSTGGIAALGVTLDSQGVSISELDLNVLLLNAREFAVEFVGILNFLDIELGSEGLQVSTDGTVTLATVLIEFVQHAEEGLEGGCRVGGDERSWEERHLAFRCWCEKNASEWKS